LFTFTAGFSAGLAVVVVVDAVVVDAVVVAAVVVAAVLVVAVDVVAVAVVGVVGAVTVTVSVPPKLQPAAVSATAARPAAAATMRGVLMWGSPR
jgi:hypothetical protein